jgi:CRP-like cAMP-binding protein
MVPKYNRNLEVQYPDGTLLGDVEPSTREALKREWREVSVPSGRMILDAEDDSHDVLLLLQGSVRVANFTSKGREVAFSTFAEGDCFGEFAVIDGAPRSASVLALHDCRVAMVPGPRFLELIRQHPDLGLVLMRSLVAKLRELTRRVSDFTALKADDRIRLEIIRLVRVAMRPDGSAVLDKPPTQSEIASFVFTNREAVAREIGRMKRKGLMTRDGRGLRIPSVAALEAYQHEMLGK